jgi:tetratricopeptide (TPR) repeat protein
VGQLHAIAAHLYGRALGRSDAARAEHALRDSIAWRTDPAHRGQVWHSLGNLLSKDRERWSDAEKAYKKSLGLDADPVSQGQTWHSMGNLLSKDHKRWPEAEDAFQKSLDLRTDPTDQGQTHASWAEMLRFSDDERRLLDAETHARAAAQLMHWHVPTMGRTHRILADVYEKLERYADAIASLENLRRTDAQLGTTKYEVQIKRRIEGLKRRLKQSTE